MDKKVISVINQKGVAGKINTLIKLEVRVIKISNLQKKNG